MRKIIFIIFCLFQYQNINAQTNTFKHCGTEDIDTTEFQQLPWFDNNPFLEHFLDSIGYPAVNNNANRIVGAPSVRFWIPIKFWIYSGTNVPTQTQVQSMIDKLNDLYNVQNNTQIGFYLKCDPANVNITANDITFLQAVNLMTTFNEKGCLNVHVVNNLTYAEGMTMKPLSINACIVNSRTYRFDFSTLAHEIGHVLGLVHTHLWWDVQYPCFRECVSRTRTWGGYAYLCGINRIRSRYVCESTGDALGDTPADPELSTNNSCDYLPQTGIFENDLWGTSYANPPNGPQERPNTHNIMSYNQRDDCVTQFSRLQIGVMLYNILLKKNILDALGWSNSISTFDNYEPDNSSITGRQIFAGEIQERNFHQQYNRNFIYGIFTQCDVDWVTFIPNCNSNLSVTTSAISGKTNANTRITLFNNNSVQLAQNDNISATNLYSSLNFNFIAGQTYFIRIENMQNLVTGYYNLLIGTINSSTIDGDNVFCNTSSTYSIPGLTTGANVFWSISPSWVATVNTPNATQTTLTKNVDGVITLTARVFPVCGNPYTIVKNNITSGTGATSLNFTRMEANCDAGPYLYASYTPIPNALNCSWYKKDMTVASNPFVFMEDGLNGVDYPLRRGNRYYTIRAVVTTACGNITSDAVVFAPNCTRAVLALSPNPVSTTLNLRTIEDKETLKTGENSIQEIIITDKMGVVVLQKKYAIGTKNISIPVNNLKADVYFIKTWNGTAWETIQFIKN
jgi:hypothetical protein